jgi:hypothetical protein
MYHKEMKGAADHLSGANLIAYRALEKYMEILLQRDEDYAPFQMLGLELNGGKDAKITIKLDDGRGVALKGSIDRLDEKEGMIRILDYKTGKSDLKFSSLDSLFDANDENRNPYAFQTLLYGLLAREWGVVREENQLHAGILSFRSNKDYRWELTLGNAPLGNLNRVMEAFEEKLKNLIKEIYNPEKHWTQVEDAGKCKNCPYNVICDR